MVQLPPAGITVALLTPLTASGAVDQEALDRLVARCLTAGVAGLSPAGSTGEGRRLSRAQRRQVAARVAAGSAGRPVICGVPLLSLDDTVEEIAGLADAGVDAALVAPPGYYPSSDEETTAVFEALADRSPLPLVLYQIPELAGAGFSAAVVGRLARHPSIVGIKDSSRDLGYLRQVVRNTAGSEFTVATGTDALLTESLAAGAGGAILASANVAPQWSVALVAAAARGESATARDLQDRLQDLVTACRRGGVPAGVKYAASLLGLCGDRMVPPVPSLGPEPRAALRRDLTALGLLDPAERAS